MQLIVVDTDSPEKLRAAAAFCLMLAGDIAVPSLSDEEIKPAVPPPAFAAHTSDFKVPAGTITREPIMPPMGNVVPFPPALPAPSTAPAAVSPAVAPALTAVAGAPLPNAPPVLPPAVTTAAAAPAQSPAAPAEYDSAGLPWDARIHQKGKSKKKDGTWKLQKGLDPTFAQAVVTELATKRRAVPTAPTVPAAPAGVPAASATVPTPPATVPPLPPLGAGPLMSDPPRHAGMVPELSAPYGTTVQPQFNHASVPPSESYSEAAARMSLVPPPPNAPQVPLPPAGQQYPFGMPGPNTVPVPPQPNGAPASLVPPPPVAAQVPPAPQPGPVGGGSPTVPPAVTPYRLLMDKLTAAVAAKQLDPRRIAPVCQKHGAPNFAELGNPINAHLVPAVERDFDALIAGLPVEGIA